MPKPKSKKNKKIAIIIIVGVVIFLSLWIYFNALSFADPDQPVKFGVTFSHKYASETLGLNWTEVYWAIIDDLKVKDLRLVAHWDMIEEREDEYNFNDLDWMISQAAKKDINVILAIGRRTPRWPECHDPVWIGNLSKIEQDKRLLAMIRRVVEYFRKYKNITAWQVENEPFLKIFGECPPPDRRLLEAEINLVRSLDNRPIMVTDAGELSNWTQAAALAEIFGITMYKAVWNPVIGVWRYPWPPVYYYYKARRVQNNYDLSKIIVSELQAEPWAPGVGNITEVKLYDQFNSFSLIDFKKNLEFTAKAGFTEAYLWGAEWWYWLKQTQNRPEFWNLAKAIWQE